MNKIIELFFSQAPWLFVALVAIIVIGTWMAFLFVGWRGEKRSFVGLLSLFSNDNGRAYRWELGDHHIAPDVNRLAEVRKTWAGRIERVRNDKADLMTVVFGRNCEHMSDEYALMWIGFVKDILNNGGLVLELIIPLISAYSTFTAMVKHEIAEAARNGRDAIPIILVIEEKRVLHELKSYENVIAGKK